MVFCFGVLVLFYKFKINWKKAITNIRFPPVPPVSPRIPFFLPTLTLPQISILSVQCSPSLVAAGKYVPEEANTTSLDPRFRLSFHTF